MRAADQHAADEAAAQEYVEKLLLDWEPAAFLPLLQAAVTAEDAPLPMKVPPSILQRTAEGTCGLLGM